MQKLTIQINFLALICLHTLMLLSVYNTNEINKSWRSEFHPPTRTWSPAHLSVGTPWRSRWCRWRRTTSPPLWTSALCTANQRTFPPHLKSTKERLRRVPACRWPRCSRSSTVRSRDAPRPIRRHRQLTCYLPGLVNVSWPSPRQKTIMATSEKIFR